jgi:predicted ribosome quality control (RQC) complex YloA/Tae2 family protein
MITDWILIRRAARELCGRFAGARVRDVGSLPDGRIALALWQRAVTRLLCIDAFGSPPLVTVEDGDLPIAAEAGFVRVTGATLRGMTLVRVDSFPADRVLQLDFTARSRFGVADGASLVVELVPRFGNVVLVKSGIVVDAMREFSLADNGTRAVLPGHAYEPPPIAPTQTVPKLIAQSYPGDAASVAQAASLQTDLAPLYVYRDPAGTLVQAHVVPLRALGESPARETSLLDVFAHVRAQRSERGVNEGAARRKAALLKRLRDREKRLRAEAADLERHYTRIAARESLREQGQSIFGTLYQLDEQAQTEAKERAAKLFAAYKKLGAALPHVQTRERHVREALEAVRDLQWEAERAGDADIADVEEAVAALEPRRNQTTAKAARKRKRVPLEFRTQSGSRILVGRSPLENADLTFRVARPNDVWLHVQGQPGAHAIVQRDDRNEPPEADIAAAARLAAYHSKARESTGVAVDYTQRKHVRKRPGAAPGLVFYTDYKTIVVDPNADLP